MELCACACRDTCRCCSLLGWVWRLVPWRWIPRQLYASTQYSAQTRANGCAMQCKQQGSLTFLRVLLFSLRQQTAWPVADDRPRLCWWCIATQFCSNCCEVVALFTCVQVCVLHLLCTESAHVCIYQIHGMNVGIHGVSVYACMPCMPCCVSPAVYCCSFCGGPQGCSTSHHCMAVLAGWSGRIPVNVMCKKCSVVCSVHMCKGMVTKQLAISMPDTSLTLVR